MAETIVVSVGGSLIVPDGIDTKFLKDIRDLILAHVDDGKKFVIITGGGKTARRYQDAAKKVIELKDWDVDWLGIHATRINAHLMRTIFHEVAQPKIITDPTKDFDMEHDIVIGAGWKPGCSTDYDAVLLARNIGAKKLLNLTNTDYVYDKDPSESSDAEPIKDVTWKELRDILPDEWSPGLNAPFDPVAAEEAEKLGLEVAIINGENLDAIEDYLEAEDFKGTLIS